MGPGDLFFPMTPPFFLLLGEPAIGIWWPSIPKSSEPRLVNCYTIYRGESYAVIEFYLIGLSRPVMAWKLFRVGMNDCPVLKPDIPVACNFVAGAADA